MFTPLQMLADWIVYGPLRLEKGSRLADALNFFIFDTLKIFILLSAIIWAVAVLRTFLPAEKVRDIVSKKSRLSAHFWAAALGIITPFCTCSAIPLFLGFVQAGIPLGVTFSFLVSSPMINEVALVMLFGMFGLKIALLYAASGVAVAVLSGLFIGRLKPEQLLEKMGGPGRSCVCQPAEEMSKSQRMAYAREYTADILRNVWPYVVIGIGLGAGIHGYVPQGLLVEYAGADKWYAVPLATLIGIPLYSNAAGVIPLVSALTEKGVALGTTLAFMMAVTGLSLPEFMILRRVMKPKLLLLFFGTVAIGIILTGFLFNHILG